MKRRHSKAQENIEKKKKKNPDTSIEIKKVTQIKYNKNKDIKIVDYINFLINMSRKDPQKCSQLS